MAKKALVVLLWLAALAPSAYFAARQLAESAAIDRYIDANGLRGPVSLATAFRVSDQVRSDFNVNEPTFTALKMDKRPFLRHDTAFLLEHREGLCGEGTRVIVNILQRLGFDASRVTLYNRHLVDVHTLASVVIDGEEHLIDSINTPDSVHALLHDHGLSLEDFAISTYAANIMDRRQYLNERPASLREFRLYSYEATPYSKLFAAAGLNVRAFTLQRPSPLLSSLAEKPNAIMAVTLLIPTLLAMSVSAIVRLCR